jgi:hypothetical protein
MERFREADHFGQRDFWRRQGELRTRFVGDCPQQIVRAGCVISYPKHTGCRDCAQSTIHKEKRMPWNVVQRGIKGNQQADSDYHSKEKVMLLVIAAGD